MDQNKCKIIVEFNGLPGCGKSAVCNELLNKLSKKNIQSSNNFDFPTPLYQRFFHALYDGSIPFCYKMGKLIWSYKSNTWSFSYSLRFAWYFYQSYIYFIKSSSSKVMIIDQGLLQLILSFCFIDPITDLRIIEQVLRIIRESPFGESLLIVNCNLDINTSLERIIGRGKTDGSRLDRLQKESRNSVVDALIVQENNLQRLRSVFSKLDLGKHVTIDMMDTVGNNASSIYSLLIRQVSTTFE